MNYKIGERRMKKLIYVVTIVSMLFKFYPHAWGKDAKEILKKVTGAYEKTQTYQENTPGIAGK